MKKVIALTLMVVCLGSFSLGCGKTEEKKPAAAGAAGAADTKEKDGAAAAPADAKK